MWPLVALGALGVVVGRTLVRSRVERAVAMRLPLGDDGIVRGAGPLMLDGSGERAVLVVHGFSDTPQSVAELARRLHADGWTVHVPLLPGHGRTLRDFAQARAGEWEACVRAAYDALRARHATVALVGQSMGGALCSILAAESAARGEGPAAVVLLAPYLGMPAMLRAVAPLAPAIALCLPAVGTGEGRSIHDPEAKAASRGYGAGSPRAVRELARVVARARAALPHVAAPTLVVQSRLDNRIAPATAADGFARLGAPEKRLEWLDGCGHVVTVDRERERVFVLVSEWLARWSARTTAAA